jgi:hypothetical protein
MTKKSKTGHRQRLRDRFLSGDAESRCDEMLLELLLTFAIGGKDVKPLSEELLRVFGNLDQVLAAPLDDLLKIRGLGNTSITLLKAIDFINTYRKRALEIDSQLTTGRDVNQLQLFQQPPSDSTPTKAQSEPVEQVGQPKIELQYPSGRVKTEKESKHKRTAQKAIKAPSDKKIIRRKLQVSNSYLLEFDQLARVLNFLLENKELNRIKRKTLKESTGFADRQVEGLVSMGTAMGLIKPNVQILTSIGLIIAAHDIFLENPATLQWIHYKAAGSYQNLIWFDAFNHLLPEEPAMTQEDWQEYFRNRLKGQYTDKTLKNHVHKEIRFVIDAYTERNFKKLELLQRSTDETLYRRRYSNFNPLVLTAMVYDFCAMNEVQLSQISEMAATPGSPAVVFGLDAASFRQQVEGLHHRGWLRYETTHNLDQIRLKPGLSAISFLSAHFEDREPREDTKQSPGGIFQ